MHRRQFLESSAVAALAGSLPGSVARGAPPTRGVAHYQPSPDEGCSRAVRVDQVPLVYTPQRSYRAASASEAEHVDLAARWLTEAVIPTGMRAVALNVAARDLPAVSTIRAALARAVPPERLPALTCAVGELRNPADRAVVDAVLAEPMAPAPPAHAEPRLAMRTWPAGPRVYISGQAEKASDLRTATRLTLDSLRRTLDSLGLALEHVVQLRSFVNPMSKVAEAEEEIARMFGSGIMRVATYVEWSSSLPIEIELVAVSPDTPREAGKIEYLTPPGMTSSPVFSRVARVADDRAIYISGLCGAPGTSAEAQVRSVFAQLGEILRANGSDLNHLAKATYFVADGPASDALNRLRPEFYDPLRPPAASKAVVRAVGRAGCTIAVDMIAVPAA